MISLFWCSWNSDIAREIQ